MGDSPNVIVFFTDQQRWDTTGAHDNPLDLTPNFDRMARHGTHMAQAFTPQPVCGPSRACLQTGTFATRNGCYRNGIPLPEQATTVAKAFNAGGYSTGYIGKWHLGGTDAEPVPEARRGGYQHWLAADVLEFTSDAYDCRLYDAENRPVKLPGYRVDALTDAAIRFIEQPRSQPYFLFLSFLEPHFQNHRDDHPAPTGYAERYTGRWTPPDLAALSSPTTGLVGGNAYQSLGGYYGMVKRLDEALGRLLDALRSLGQLDNTIVAFTSDHGCHFKTRNSEYKRSGHDASIRVPMALTGSIFNGGGRLEQMMSLVDLAPTLLDAAGLPVPDTMQGRSIVPLVRRQQTAWPDDVFVQVSESQVGRFVRTHRWKYGIAAPGRDPVEDSGAAEYEEQYLYDLFADPHELKNLIGWESHRVVVDRMKERLLAWMQRAGEAPPRITSALVIPSGQRRVDPAEVEQ